MSLFRTIALRNIVAKLITKKANRLKPLIEKLAGPDQTSFIPNRQAADNMILVQELIHSMRRKMGGKGAMAIKIDLEKVYDRTNLEFLRKILITVGFELKLVELIMFCLQSTKLSVIWNGEKLEPFRPQRGLR